MWVPFGRPRARQHHTAVLGTNVVLLHESLDPSHRVLLLDTHGNVAGVAEVTPNDLALAGLLCRLADLGDGQTARALVQLQTSRSQRFMGLGVGPQSCCGRLFMKTQAMMATKMNSMARKKGM